MAENNNYENMGALAPDPLESRSARIDELLDGIDTLSFGDFIVSRTSAGFKLEASHLVMKIAADGTGIGGEIYGEERGPSQISAQAAEAYVDAFLDRMEAARASTA